MPKRASSYQSTGTYTDDATLYDSSVTTGYTLSGGLLGTVGISGKLNLGASPTATKSVKYYWKWEDAYTRILESSNDDITYTPAVGSTPGVPNGGSGAQYSTFTLTTATSFQYWRLSLQNQDTVGAPSSVSLMEFEALDASGVHINENISGAVALVPVGTSTSVGAATVTTPGIKPIGVSVSVGVAVLTGGTPLSPKAKSSSSGNVVISDKRLIVPVASSTSVGVGVMTSDPNLIYPAGSSVSVGAAVLGAVQQLIPLGVSSSQGQGSSGAIVIFAQSMFDYVDWYPGIGDVWGHLSCSYYNNGVYGTPFELRAGKEMRSAAWGVVNGSAPRAPFSGANMVVTETKDPKAPSGNGVSDSDGRYLTGTPNGRGELDMTIECRSSVTPSPTAGVTFKARKRHRVSFLQTPLNAFSAVESCSERGWLHAASGKKVYTFFEGTNEVAFKSADLAPDTWMHMNWDARRATLYLVGKLGSLFKVYSSLDGGQNVLELNSVTGKSGVIRVDSERGIVIWLYQDNSDVIYQQQSIDGGMTWSTAVATMLDGVALKGSLLDITNDRRKGGALFMTTQGTGSNPMIKVITSTDNGLNWKTLNS